MSVLTDKRTVLTLDAGGTNFAFSAIQGGAPLGEAIALPAEPDDLDASLDNLISGFRQLIDQLPDRPVAISFAFPGPADYPQGIIYNVGNLPAYQGGVALGPMLEEQFDIPVFINNDGDLFAYGEAMAGFLPRINGMLADNGSPKRYRNLFAVTLGTGFGGEIWILRNKVRPAAFAEEGASIRAVQGSYAESAGIAFEEAPSPKEIFDIGMGTVEGNQAAAIEAFETLGEVVGNALANALTLIDGLAVIGGGLGGAAPLFMPRLIAEMNGTINKYNGEQIPRLAQKVFDLTDKEQTKEFLHGETKDIVVPRSDKRIQCDPQMRIGVGISELGTNQATSLGAYAIALHELDTQ